eukprot:scaffold11076_cov122-Cylindrotheca_fusiformis.AAC.1
MMPRTNLLFILIAHITAGNGFSLKSSFLLRRRPPLSQIRPPRMAKDDSFWTQQRDLMESLLEKNERSVQKEQQNQFAKRQSLLISDTAFFTTLIFSGLWLLFDNPFFPLSYVFGSIFGIFYAYGLGKYVQTIGGSIEDAGAVQGAGVGQARFAFLILLFICVGKLQSAGLIPIPAILGFFTYQIASLTQGLREFDD